MICSPQDSIFAEWSISNFARFVQGDEPSNALVRKSAATLGGRGLESPRKLSQPFLTVVPSTHVLPTSVARGKPGMPLSLLWIIPITISTAASPTTSLC